MDVLRPTVSSNTALSARMLLRTQVKRPPTTSCAILATESRCFHAIKSCSYLRSVSVERERESNRKRVEGRWSARRWIIRAIRSRTRASSGPTFSPELLSAPCKAKASPIIRLIAPCLRFRSLLHFNRMLNDSCDCLHSNAPTVWPAKQQMFLFLL